jgi:hypothetical protein
MLIELKKDVTAVSSDKRHVVVPAGAVVNYSRKVTPTYEHRFVFMSKGLIVEHKEQNSGTPDWL